MAAARGGKASPAYQPIKEKIWNEFEEELELKEVRDI